MVLKDVIIVYFFQHLMSGWFWDYSYKCQPVDYSYNKKALRVSLQAKCVRVYYCFGQVEIVSCLVLQFVQCDLPIKNLVYYQLQD